MHTSLPRLAVAACVLVAAFASAQDSRPDTVETKLLDILRGQGVITSAQHAELTALGADLRRREDVESRIAEKVDEAVVRMNQDAPKLSYKPGGGFTMKSADEKFALTFGARLQVRFTYDVNEDESPNNPDGDDRQNFAVQRARLYFTGHAWDPKLRYSVQIDVAGETVTAGASTSAGRFAALRDGWFEYAFDPAFTVRGGQFKAPFSRQQMNAAFKQEFVDRAPTDAVFALGREPGLMAYGKLGGEKADLFEYSAGLFNGEGSGVNNDDDGLRYVARVAVNPFGGMSYAEADLRPEEERGKFLLQLGANVAYEQDDFGFAGDADRGTNEDDLDLGVDVSAAWHGFYFQSEAFARSFDDVADRDLYGWYAQLGYMIVPKTFEVALRYGAVDWDYSTVGLASMTAATRASLQTAAREYLIALSYYFHGHDLKAQLDFGRVEDHRFDRATSASDFDAWRLRFQVTLSF